MEFKVSFKKEYILTKIFGPQPNEVQSFFKIIDQINSQIQELYTVKPCNIVFDLSHINFIDSYLISALVRAYQISILNKHAILITDENILSIIELVGLDQLFQIYKSKADFDENFLK